MTGAKWRFIAVVALVALIGAGWLVWRWYGLDGMPDSTTLRHAVDRAGLWGPALVVGLMTVAVVASPIPSAPIALAAGAAYGHIWGTIYVIAGAEAGALIAFAIARVLGHGPLRKWFGDRLDVGLLGSQNALMLTIFASRLMPFVSFDLISYAAGLSALGAGRFALATFAGIVPASFLLAHFGGEVASADIAGATWTVLALGAITGLPVLWIVLRGRSKKGGREKN